MFDANDLWLLISVLLVISLQGAQLTILRSKWHLLLIGIAILTLTTMLSDLVSKTNILKLNLVLERQQQLIFLLALLEAALICFHKPIYKLPMASAVGALLYGQLLFFQSGILTQSFALQGALYGLSVFSLLLLNRQLAKIETLWRFILIIFFVGLVMITTASSSTNTSRHLSIDINALIVSTISIMLLLLSGYVLGTVQNLRNRN